jgi:2-dehydro-3-deoxyglucarate aldolase/4-hydroxy-2-oxoheptanedioate aldolase
MKPNRTKQAIKAGHTVVGTMISDLNSVEVPYILAAAGMDFLMVDTEHCSTGMESTYRIVQSARSNGLTPLVRVTDNTYTLIARTLDLGAMGVMVPRVHTAEQARQAVSHAKYPPVGNRGYAARGVVTEYKAATMPEVIAWVNEHTLIIVQVESVEALSNLEEITQVPGIDVALVGPSDLSISLGVPGEFQHSHVVEAIKDTFEICLKNGVSPSIYCGDMQTAKYYLDIGMKFVMYSSDGRMLLAAASDAVRQLAGESRASRPTATR